MSFIRSLATVVDNSRRRLHTWADENPEGMAKLALWLEDTSRNETSFADLAGSLLKSWVPLNWWHLQIGKQQRAVSLMTETGICLVWVPPLEILEAILEAACKEERDGSTQLRRSWQRRRTHRSPRRWQLHEALSAYRAKLIKPAQSLAATILSGVVEDHYGFDEFSSARSAFERESADARGRWSVRRTAVQEAIRIAILKSNRRPPGAGFNRHLSVHGVSEEQFTPAHALAGLMLVGGALRELHEIYRVTERGFGPSPRLDQHARDELRRRISELPGYEPGAQRHVAAAIEESSSS